jgi:hypothetical protein
LYAKVFPLVLASGCGFGLKAATGVSRTSSPVSLASTIGESPVMADASLSSSFVELESMGEYKHVRGIVVLGSGNNHARYREIGASSMTTTGKDDNVLLRAGIGIAIAPVTLGRVRPVPYVLYATNFESTQNVVKHGVEAGVDLEITDSVAAAVVGIALLRETGESYADFTGGDVYQSTYSTTGLMVSVGFRLLGFFAGDDE